MRKLSTLAGVAVLLVCSTACARAATACTLIGSSDFIDFRLDPTIASRVDSVVVTLCQGDRCRSGVVHRLQGDVSGHSFGIDADRELGGGWRPGRVNAEATASTSQGVVVTHRTETFTWTRFYPNGKQCDRTPYLHHTMRLGG